MRDILRAILFVFAAFALSMNSAYSAAGQNGSAKYKIVDTRQIMGVSLSFTDRAARNSEKNGSTLQASIQKLSPFFFIALTAAGSQTPHFKGYIIDQIGPTKLNSVTVAAIVVGGNDVELTPGEMKKNSAVRTFISKLKKNRLSFAKSKGRGIDLSM